MRLKPVHEHCSGCNICRLVCALENFREVNPSRGLLRIRGRFPAPGVYRIHVCDQCGVCADHCPEDAIHFEENAFAVIEEACTGCGICIEVCPYDVMFSQEQSGVPVKCNLCGECSRACPRDAILLVEEQTRGVA